MLAILLALVGLLIGPLLGIVVDRAVERERPELNHRCRTCGTSLGSTSLIPVLSWFARCPTDRSHRNLRYPAVDILTAASFAVAGLRFGWTWQLGPYLLLFAVLVVMSVIDYETHLLLDILTWPSLGVGLFLVLVLSGVMGYEEGIWPALVGAIVYGVIMFLAYRAYPPGLGMGDAKLAPTLGLFLGWLSTTPMGAIRLVFYALIVAMLGAGLLGLALRMVRVNDKDAELPLGPALAMSAVLMIVVSDSILTGLA